MRAVDIIRKKRDRIALDASEIDFFVEGVTAGAIPDYQASAFLMATRLNGMTPDETVRLTDAMVRSGIRVDLSAIPGVKVDKHSTGGVGDKTSLVLAPLAAACGVVVPMMSGRALGHTGGTVDKLESIPGFRTSLSLDELREALSAIGCALISQTAEIAPADKKLYALRDVTATIDSIPLICGSIMSKKIAEGIDALVLDVKVGRGAFMKTEAQARELAKALVAIGNRSGVRTEALITDMDTPLGRAVGNAIEVKEAIATLKGQGPPDLELLSVLLAARMLVLAGVARSLEEAERRVRGALTSGAAIDKLRQILARQGGNPRIVDDDAELPAAPGRHVVTAPRVGHVRAVDAERIGRASMALGAGRDRAEDAIDPGAGLVLLVKPGDEVRPGDPLVELHHRQTHGLQEAEALAGEAIQIADEPPAARPLVIEVIV